MILSGKAEGLLCRWEDCMIEQKHSAVFVSKNPDDGIFQIYARLRRSSIATNVVMWAALPETRHACLHLLENIGPNELFQLLEQEVNPIIRRQHRGEQMEFQALGR